MESGVKFFGGDCEPSFHVLTDDVDTVPSHLNPAYAPYVIRACVRASSDFFFEMINIPFLSFFGGIGGLVVRVRALALALVCGSVLGIASCFPAVTS